MRNNMYNTLLARFMTVGFELGSTFAATDTALFFPSRYMMNDHCTRRKPPQDTPAVNFALSLIEELAVGVGPEQRLSYGRQ